jgi:hypothetical protein
MLSSDEFKLMQQYTLKQPFGIMRWKWTEQLECADGNASAPVSMGTTGA